MNRITQFILGLIFVFIPMWVFFTYPFDIILAVILVILILLGLFLLFLAWKNKSVYLSKEEQETQKEEDWGLNNMFNKELTIESDKPNKRKQIIKQQTLNEVNNNESEAKQNAEAIDRD